MQVRLRIHSDVHLWTARTFATAVAASGVHALKAAGTCTCMHMQCTADGLGYIADVVRLPQCALLANAAGIGGGPFYVPLFNVGCVTVSLTELAVVAG